MAFDLLITNGLVVDGTGATPFLADLAIANGRIAEIGPVQGAAERVIDASGWVVAPGFIDPHTHYDAQFWWDSALTPSPWHGVTSVVMGNCGVGIAPCSPSARKAAMQDLVTVEGIPFDVMEMGIEWQWETFPQFIDAAQRRGSAINIGFLAPLSPFRYAVMGDGALDRAATPSETRQIAASLEDAIHAGALGFSTTQLPNHIDHQGRPLACRNASLEELGEYAGVLGKLGHGAIEIALTKQVSVLSDEECRVLDILLAKSHRPVTWLALLHRNDIPDACRKSREKAHALIRRGALPQISPRPMVKEINMQNPYVFAAFSCWQKVLNKPKEMQKAIYADPIFRNAFRTELKHGASFTGQWELVTVAEVGTLALKSLEGRTIAEISREQQLDGVDVLLNLALEDDLRTQLTLVFLNSDEEGLLELLTDPGTLVGLSDGGAHLDVLCDAGYCTYMLGKWVRERRALSLECAVKRITSEPADFFGLSDRGRLNVGLAADVVVFDAQTIGSGMRGQRVYDLPGGGKRMVMPSVGVMHTIVNGTMVFENGAMNDARPGQILRC